jgi:predicted transposase/invertase (TIGR01784 family)
VEGEQFIVELQKAKQNYFIDRSIYYASFPIQQQAPRGEWDYHLRPVYCVGILDFKFDESSKNEHKYMHRVMLTDIETQDVFYEKLCFIYLEMPKFQKDIPELKDRKDKWLYFIKNLDSLQNIPKLFIQDIAFQKAFDEAEIAKFNRKQQNQYEKSLKYYRDLKNVTDTAFFEGKEEGIVEGFEMGKEEGIEIGIELGEKKGIGIGEEKERRKTIIKFLKKGKLEPEDIADTLDIPLAIVLQIKQEENL